MKALILAGGYGTRLRPHILSPKALLEIGGKPILSNILENLCRVENIERILISTNETFRQHFESYFSITTWLKPVQLVIEPSNSEGRKLGSVGAIQFVLNKLCLSEDLLILAGDNLFKMALSSFMQSAKTYPIIGVFDVLDKKLATEYGVVTIDADGIIKDFFEKPENPNSTLVSTAIYYFPKEVLNSINEYLSKGGSNDRLGDFISWLYKRMNVYTHIISGQWFDIGSIDSLKAAYCCFGGKKRNEPGTELKS
jgi:glucose-1-phosphate thymidylyltransferase